VDAQVHLLSDPRHCRHFASVGAQTTEDYEPKGGIMRRYGLCIAIGLLIIVNVIVWAGVAYNRSGEPDTTITLTERELPLDSYRLYADRENTGLSLKLDFSNRDYFPRLFPSGGFNDHSSTEWFDKAKLEAIGFDCKLPLNDPSAEIHYQRMLPRKTYAVLEYNGSAWESWLAAERNGLIEKEKQAQKDAINPERLKDARKEFDREFRTRSRLFIIDVANDPNALRKQYVEKEKYLIVPATAQLIFQTTYEDNGKKVHRLLGTINNILTDTMYVPKNHRPILEKLLREKRGEENRDYSYRRERGPSYEAKVHYGKRFEPWIADIRELVVETPK
jgi:hypothetical protein